MSQGPRKYLKPVLGRILKPIAAWYFSKPRKDTYEGIMVTVPPGVFHPRFFFSTRLMLKHLHRYDLRDRSFLEIGAGSGLISLWAAKQGASVTCTDINPLAVETVQKNALANALSCNVLESDLFDSLPEFRYDFVVVNPPYYPKQPKTAAEHAWFCGEDHMYFRRLFEALHSYRNPDSKVLMVLSEDCDVSQISKIAASNHWDMEMIHPEQKWGEWSFIYSLRYKRVA